MKNLSFRPLHATILWSGTKLHDLKYNVTVPFKTFNSYDVILTEPVLIFILES